MVGYNLLNMWVVFRLVSSGGSKEVTNKYNKEQMIPYVPTWEAHNTSAHNLVGKFTKAYCNVPRGKVQGQKYCIAVQSFLALAQQLMGNNKDNIYLGISKNNNHWSQYAVGRVIIAKLRTDLELSGIIKQLEGTGY